MSESVNTIQVGQNVPDFEITCYSPEKKDFENLSLANQKKTGRWTCLVFYPADFTFVCATEFAALADQQSKLKDLGCDVVTVSTDTQFTHKAWQEHEGELKNVKYLMGADTNGNLARMLGVMLPGGLALRGTFIIGPDGKLWSSEVNFLNLGRNMEELVRKVQANVYLSKHNGEVCPANWKKAGDKTLKPSAAMVGKVHEAMKG